MLITLTAAGPSTNKVPWPESTFYTMAKGVPYLDQQLVKCDCNGYKLTNMEHDVSLNIPDSNIVEGRIISLEVAIAMYGPFTFPENTRPISPIVWFSVMDKDIEFNNPFQVVLPHFLSRLPENKAGIDYVRFAKAERNCQDDQCYPHFKYCNERPQFSSGSGTRNYGILDTNDHDCFFCLCAPQTSKLNEEATYHLVRIEMPISPWKYEIHFCVVYSLDTYLRVRIMYK